VDKRGVFSPLVGPLHRRVLAIAGTVLAWLPLAAPLVFALVSLASDGRFRFDYLMPAEVFPVALVGGALLLAAAILAHSRVRWIVASLAAAVILLVGSQAIAWFTGLATGRIEAAGWPWAIVLAALIGYELAVAALGVGGVLLIRSLFRRSSVP
jgi:hypothetical protein